MCAELTCARLLQNSRGGRSKIQLSKADRLTFWLQCWSMFSHGPKRLTFDFWVPKGQRRRHRTRAHTPGKVHKSQGSNFRRRAGNLLPPQGLMLKLQPENGPAPASNPASPGKLLAKERRFAELRRKGSCFLFDFRQPKVLNVLESQGSLKDTFCPFETWLFPPK